MKKVIEFSKFQKSFEKFRGLQKDLMKCLRIQGEFKNRQGKIKTKKII